eukprot:TRINITY_DN11773_c1_g1_i12.p4 TRINITY_DN11773_c1_g1~~TRINITY_DN11773_c1_g1_i12.p4  ORF type:complete len:102 (-),score=7.90 TRINITY_DN11773_c1_g1_i12:521-826(-)
MICRWARLGVKLSGNGLLEFHSSCLSHLPLLIFNGLHLRFQPIQALLQLVKVHCSDLISTSRKLSLRFSGTHFTVLRLIQHYTRKWQSWHTSSIEIVSCGT